MVIKRNYKNSIIFISVFVLLEILFHSISFLKTGKLNAFIPVLIITMSFYFFYHLLWLTNPKILKYWIYVSILHVLFFILNRVLFSNKSLIDYDIYFNVIIIMLFVVRGINWLFQEFLSREMITVGFGSGMSSSGNTKGQIWDILAFVTFLFLEITILLIAR